MNYLSTSALVLGAILASGALEARDARIIGGTKADYNNWKFFGQIIGNSEGASHSRCGASYIGNNFMLTAAHCVDRVRDPKSIRIKFSPNNYTDEPENVVNVTKIIVHPSYNSKGFNSHDVALLKIDKVIAGVETITLPNLPLEQYVAPGTSLDVAGLGTEVIGNLKPSKLNEVSIEYVSNKTCIDSHEALNETNIGVTNFCAGDSTGAGLKDTCTGDSGGPLILRDGDKPVQLGIVSFGISCAKPNMYGIYADVPKFVGWINSTVTANK
ncbi:Putative Trypsin-like serine protease [Vibrio nigripulchritudo MADA3029]|uniref:S1 family peptidase n=1 Tax=Vibrio nigripulchritudo TaxID=28173 RepID=UPI0003B1DC12|nr:serine protease [Vibrio nigripulchritudo]CCN49120.1 Putative Trypsin-like serine protease [Vibrio nigripulchritudo MADA3020]CCN56274.1 Putative Trypsin-like serine protease [Vibrio nigripulchritudo MADA3021]CCN57841.1 Putative Trypsin-like serine protease [Vibrio nigripulchritudo MADA3029]